MNIALDIINRLKDKDYDDFTKIRYIYLYLCNTFSYDSRFYDNMQPKLREEIYYKQVDITNVQEFELVCFTLSKILIDLLALFGYEGRLIVEDTSSTYSHTYVLVDIEGYRLKLDPTKQYDTARTKAKLATYGFTDLDKGKDIHSHILEADRKIYDYTKKFFSWDYYHNSQIKQFCMLFNKVATDLEMTGLGVFNKKLEQVCQEINLSYSLTRHNDINYYLSYLLGMYDLKKDDAFVRGITFFNKEDTSDIIDIFHVKYRNQKECFYVLKKEEYWHIEETSPREVLKLLDNYESNNSYYFEQLANKLASKKGRGLK